jgi:hypothetical protein
MPLSQAAPRNEIHHRVIDMMAYAREDGFHDIEAHLVDRKPFPVERTFQLKPIPPGEPLHDLWIRVTVDAEYVVRRIEASSDATPFPVCKEAASTLDVLVGERIATDWSFKGQTAPARHGELHSPE